MTEPAELRLVIREQLFHNAGRSAALSWLLKPDARSEITSLLNVFTASSYSEPLIAAYPGLTEGRVRLVAAVAALAAGDTESASVQLQAANTALPQHFENSARDIGWALIRDLVTVLISPTAPGRSITVPLSREPGTGRKSWTTRQESQAKQELRRLTAPQLLRKGLPGPPGIWIRPPHPGESGTVERLLHSSDDSLDPSVNSAIENGSLSSILRSLLQDDPIEETALRLSQGGAEAMISGFTIVLVAVNNDARIVGAVQLAPPFVLLSNLKPPYVSNQHKQHAAVTIMKISGIGVSQPYRGRGIGRALATHASDLSWRCGYRLLYGQYKPASGLARFLHSCGFEVSAQDDEGIRLDQYGLPHTGIRPEPAHRFFVAHRDAADT
jgi:GNAT superfamily N-acetyltransferase